jgi:hypothetical protein
MSKNMKTDTKHEDEKKLMDEYSITFDGKQYQFKEYKYDKLSDAVNYAILKEGSKKTFLNKNITDNLYYWIYTATLDKINENTKPEEYLWNRWSINELKDNHEELKRLQNLIDETSPSWEISIQLLNIKELSSEEKSDLIQYINEKKWCSNIYSPNSN